MKTFVSLRGKKRNNHKGAQSTVTKAHKGDKSFIGLLLLFLPLFIQAEGKEIPFILDDRDRIIIGIFTTMMVSVFGFAFWDRKLSLSPVKPLRLPSW